MSSSKIPLTIFLHIPKAGGTTLRSVISRQYSKNEIIDAPPLILTPKLDAAVIQDYLNSHSKLSHLNQDVRIIRGHLVFGIHKFLNQPATYMTMLRHPIKRVVSTYYYMLKAYPEYMLWSKHEPFLNPRKEKSGSNYSNRYITFEEFLKCDESLFSAKLDLSNGQVRRIAGYDESLSSNFSSNLTDTALDVAKQNLKDKIHVFGIMEEYDKSLILLKRYFKWDNVFYFKLNQSQKHTKSINGYKELVTEQGLSLAKHLNYLDLELYDYAKDIFDQRIVEEHESFERELKRFQLVNPTLGASHALMQSVLRKLLR